MRRVVRLGLVCEGAQQRTEPIEQAPLRLNVGVGLRGGDCPRFARFDEIHRRPVDRLALGARATARVGARSPPSRRSERRRPRPAKTSPRDPEGAPAAEQPPMRATPGTATATGRRPPEPGLQTLSAPRRASTTRRGSSSRCPSIATRSVQSDPAANRPRPPLRRRPSTPPPRARHPALPSTFGTFRPRLDRCVQSRPRHDGSALRQAPRRAPGSGRGRPATPPRHRPRAMPGRHRANR